MKPVFHPLHQAAAAGFSPAAPSQNGPPPAAVQSHSRFHQERAGVLRPMARHVPPPPPRQRQAPQPRTAAQQEQALLDAFGDLGAGGHQGGSGQDSGGEAGHDGQRRAAREIGARAAAGRAPAPVSLEEQPKTGDGAALDQLQQRLGGGAEVGGAAVLDDALALADSLSVHGDGALAGRVAALRRRLGADPAMHRAGAAGVQVWTALRMSASVGLLESCLQHGAGLHAQLRAAGLLGTGGTAERVGIALLQASRTGSPAELAQRIGARAGAGKDGRHASQLLAATLRLLPLALWPGADARGKQLALLDADATGEPPTNTNEARVERDLRAHQEKRHD